MNRRWTQIYADNVGFDGVHQKASGARFLYALIQFFGGIREEIARFKLQPWPNFPDLNGALPFYLRKSASICGSSWFYLYSRSFVACRALGLAKADPFAVES